MKFKPKDFHKFRLQRKSRRQLSQEEVGLSKLKWEVGTQRAKGTILHEFPFSVIPNKVVKGKENEWQRWGHWERHNCGWEGEKSNQFGDANFMEHQLRRAFMTHFGRKENTAVVPLLLEDLLWMPPPLTHTHTYPQPQQHWAQPLMGWHLLSACPRPHWGNEAVSVCCSGSLYAPFITVTAQRHIERGGQRGALLSNLSCFGLYDHRPHVASTPPETHTSPSLPCGHGNLFIGSLRLPRYASAPLMGTRVVLLTRQWQERQDGQCLTSEWPTHAPVRPHSPLCFCRLRVNLLKAGAGTYPLLPTALKIYYHTVTRVVLL